MNDFLNKISLYDQLGYIAVGGMFYGFVWFDFSYFGIKLDAISSNTFLIAVLVYFLGHMAQAISNQFIKENKTIYSEGQKKVLVDIKKFFNIFESSDAEAWNTCYLWAIGHDKTGHINIFNANYGLYRGWAVVLGIQTLIFFALIVYDATCCMFAHSNLVGLILCLLFGLLTFKRSKRFYKYLGDKVFQTFIIESK